MHTTRATHQAVTPAHTLTAVLKTILSPLATYLQRQKNRREVEAMFDLSPHLLRDVGLTRGDVAEAVAARASADPAAVLKARRAQRLARDGQAFSAPGQHGFEASFGRSITTLSKTLTGGHWPS